MMRTEIGGLSPPSPLKKIYIIARGASYFRCPDTTPDQCEIWGCNAIYRDRKVDRLFIMHDIMRTLILEDIYIAKNINERGCPVYTTGSVKGLNNNIEFPIDRVMADFECGYFF